MHAKDDLPIELSIQIQAHVELDKVELKYMLFELNQMLIEDQLIAEKILRLLYSMEKLNSK